ncbi:V-type ATP synthase subunit D [Imhoffiella purpurea]|uniref:V-type ATP synthase subunit D n=1 Tax=Imhoffiella purpurea TaxID=1249627 RepID=W9VUS4_9GAMM|nr:V-type ATP synthase subunit D [Imhoffiella purpurea]EXJ14135.1 hypothetical protein D779_2949 [Imhoffiella purpurea]
MTDETLVPTQSARLELAEERTGLREGYRFLDEKRLILAAEMLAEIRRYETARRAFDADYAHACDLLKTAIVRQGLDGLEVYPAMPALEGVLDVRRRSVLGVSLEDVEVELGERAEPPPGVEASPEADACRAAFAVLVPKAAQLAAMAANLERLRADYARTARRARALEDVLLPEVDQRLAHIEAALEELEREESVRARIGAGWSRG